MTSTSKHRLPVRFSNVLILLAAFLVFRVQGYSRGAPDSACISMVPGHSATPKTTPSPFGLAGDKTAVGPGEMVQIAIGTLPGNTAQFKGFVVQARDKNNPGQVLGIFEQPVDRIGNLLNCAQGIQNGVTHANSARKQRAVLKWQAPADFEGEVVFRATFVEDFNTYWTNVESESVRVTRSITEVVPAVPSPTPTQSYTAPPPPSSVATQPPTSASTVNFRPSVGTAWSFTTSTPPSRVTQYHKIYDGCGENKGCFGIPANCVDSGSCQAVASYTVKADRYEFELRGLVDRPNDGGYIAIGFSKDQLMGDDSITECVYKPTQTKQISVYNSQNNGKANIRLPSQAGLKLLAQSVEDGYMYCKFEREQKIQIDGVDWDLMDKYHLLVARGDVSGDKPSYHAQNKLATAEPIDIASVSAATGKSDILIRVHGALMVGAWIWAASCGILLARYFKQTWVGTQLMGKDLWFVFHRVLMVTAWLLTIAGFILIFVEIGGWSSIPKEINPHPILGCITTGLAFIQPFMAFFRPHPGTSKRWIFNWAHWFVGNSAHMIGVACIFLAVELPKAGLTGNEGVMYWLLGSYVAFHVTMHLIFSVHQCCQDSEDRGKDFDMKDFGGQNGVTPFTVDRKIDAPGSGLRKLLFALYFLVITAISAALIAMIVLGPEMQNKSRASKA